MSAEPIEAGEYEICRECADVGATEPGNDGWVRHEDCARDRNGWPHLHGLEFLAGVTVWVYEGGKVRCVPGLRYSTSKMPVVKLADYYGTVGEDYDTLHRGPTFRLDAEGGSR